MSTVILVIHLLIAVALVATVLLQRSEGGALGIGGGGGGGGFMSGRGTANLLTRVTAFLAAAFFCTSILLTILARQSADPTSILEGVQTPQQESGETAPDIAPLTPGLPEGPKFRNRDSSESRTMRASVEVSAI